MLLAASSSLAYRSADRVAVISDSFRENLAEKGVPGEKIARIYNPASRPVRAGCAPVRRDRSQVPSSTWGTSG